MMKRVAQLLLWSGFGLLAGLVLVIVFEANYEPAASQPGTRSSSPSGAPHVGATRAETQGGAEVTDPERSDLTDPSVEAATSIEPSVAALVAGPRSSVGESGAQAGRAVVPATAAEPTKTLEPSRDDTTTRPRGWCFHTGVKNQRFASDSNAVWDGSQSVLIGRDDDNYLARASGMNTLWQVVDATPYQGSRLVFAVHVNVKVPDTVMLFVDAKSDQELALRPRYETKPQTIARRAVGVGWTQLSVVTDISPESAFLYYGVSYAGAAPVWVDDVRLENGAELPITQAEYDAPTFFPVDPSSVLARPTNLSFEMTSETMGLHDCEKQI